jgi:hypothetical protein
MNNIIDGLPKSRPHQFILVSKMAIEATMRHAGRLHHFGNTGRFDPLFPNQVRSGSQNPFVRLLFLGF